MSLLALCQIVWFDASKNMYYIQKFVLHKNKINYFFGFIFAILVS